MAGGSVSRYKIAGISCSNYLQDTMNAVVPQEHSMQSLKDQQLIVGYTYVATIALLIYDYLLTIRLEVKLVWFSPWNYTKVLFLLTRYIPMINIYFLIHNVLLFDVSPESCEVTVPVCSWLFLVGIVFAEAILMIRTWAVWLREWRIGLFLVIVLTVCAILASINNNKFLGLLKFESSPYPEFRGCFMTGFSNTLSDQFSLLAVVDGVALVMMIISALQTYRLGFYGKLSNLIHRDAIFFYVYLLLCSVANASISSIAPASLMIVLVPLQSALHSILACRIVYNLRSAAGQGFANATSVLYSNRREMVLSRPEFRRESHLHNDEELNLGINTQM